jgi:hypothetical protein
MNVVAININVLKKMIFLIIKKTKILLDEIYLIQPFNFIEQKAYLKFDLRKFDFINYFDKKSMKYGQINIQTKHTTIPSFTSCFPSYYIPCMKRRALSIQTITIKSFSVCNQSFVD